jgi:hypothetical protein
MMTVITVRELRFCSLFAIVFDANMDRVPVGDCMMCTVQDSKERVKSPRTFADYCCLV